MMQAMLDVRTRFDFVHRADMKRRDDALAKLLHIGALHCVAKLGLTNQKALQQCAAAQLEIGQRAQLLNSPRREILSLVHYEENALALSCPRDHMHLKR